jgi:hypothetical protein
VEPAAIARALEAQGTVYRGERYTGLVSPSSVVLPERAATELPAQMAAIWQWNRTWHDLYSEQVAGGEEDHWLVRSTEWGTSPKALAVQRRPDVLARDPHVGRVDSVTLDPVQRVAEVQWKGGGEGFAAGIQSAYLRLRDPGRDEHALGGRLLDTWAAFFRAHARGDHAFVVNSSRATWAPSERFLIDGLRERGVEMTFVPRNEIGSVIRVEGGAVLAPFGSRLERVDVIYLDRLSEALPVDLFDGLVGAYLDGAVHVDPPPTYLYSQKFGFVLPFHRDYRDRFSDAVRELLIPSAPIGDEPPDLEPIAGAVEHPRRDLLGELREWEDLQRLPVSLRRALVAKCGSVNGRLNNAGRGVWRLGAAATLEAVLERVRGRGEPWILQPYLNRRWPVPLAHPDDASAHPHAAHGRFLVYASAMHGTHELLGGLATFSTFWKAAGKDAGEPSGGRPGGAAFVDLRVGA